MPTNTDLDYRQMVAAEHNVQLEQAKQAGRAYITSTRKEVTSSGGTANLLIRNPVDSGVVAHVKAMSVSTQFEGVVDVYDSFTTAPSGGSNDGIDNLLMDKADTVDDGAMTTKTGVTFTAGDPHVVDVVSGGGPGGKVGGQLTPTEPIIEPDREIVIEVTNQSGTTNSAAITVVYTEEKYTA